jgi:hypothetical protein
VLVRDKRSIKEIEMRVPSSKLSRAHYIICPYRESDELISLGHDFTRCKLLEDIKYGVRTGAHPYAEAGLAHLARTFEEFA